MSMMIIVTVMITQMNQGHQHVMESKYISYNL